MESLVQRVSTGRAGPRSQCFDYGKFPAPPLESPRPCAKQRHENALAHSPRIPTGCGIRHVFNGDLVLPDLVGTDPSSEKFSGRAKVLKELVEHHADEEEKEMFPRARKLLSRDELARLGEQLEARKEALLANA